MSQLTEIKTAINNSLVAARKQWQLLKAAGEVPSMTEARGKDLATMLTTLDNKELVSAFSKVDIAQLKRKLSHELTSALMIDSYPVYLSTLSDSDLWEMLANLDEQFDDGFEDESQYTDYNNEYSAIRNELNKRYADVA